MARVNVDPGELRRFSKDLHRFNQELEQMMSALGARAGQMAQTWRDQEHRKFAEQMNETMRVLQRFLKASDEHVRFLNRKAEQAELYLNQR